MTASSAHAGALAGTLLPTTMVGSYPRPQWYTHQLHGRDFLVALKDFRHQEAYYDATRCVISDQEAAGLDLLTDGQMYFDQYTMGIGSFLWYWFERIDGFDPAKLPHPKRARAGIDAIMFDEAGGVRVTGPVGDSHRIRLPVLYQIAQSMTTRPVKCCVGAGPVQLSGLAYLDESPYKTPHDLALALADVFNHEMKELVKAGAKFLQLEDLGAWYPNLTGGKGYDGVREVLQRTVAGVDAFVSYHFCFGNSWGNMLHGMTKGGYGHVLPNYFDLDVHEFVLDFACREMVDVAVLKDLPRDKRIAAGVIDVRTLEIEAPEQVAARIRKVIDVVDPARVTLTTDCGMLQLPRHCAANKLKALVAGAEIVRGELTGKTTRPAPDATAAQGGARPGGAVSSCC